MKMPSPPKSVRCAIYTRKSSEEGLDQSFNSLHAQREACEAYILSQAHEGWKLVETDYNDGGFSGGNVERPALKQLLADIDAGLIDLVLVYKVDRLSRSLADFVRLVERFDQKDIAFVSVTQQFNTASSMGRLTLNVLLSFAQFEREVTGERIRDKIAASKKKGMWMGGAVPLGYDVIDRQLNINETEAEQVRQIYQRYLEVKSVKELKQWCEANGIHSKRRTTHSGKTLGGNPFTRGALYNILKNPIYIGKIAHQDKLFDGQHDAILDKALWQQVQDQLEANRRRKQLRTDAKHPSLLTGLLYDDMNNPMSPSHAKKGNRRYCYYVSQAKLQMRPETAGSLVSISSDILDPLVLQMIKDFLTDEDQVLSHLPVEEFSAEQRIETFENIYALAKALSSHSIQSQIQTLNEIVDTIVLGKKHIEVSLNKSGLSRHCLPSPSASAIHHASEPIVLRETVDMKRSGLESRLISAKTDSNHTEKQPAKALGAATLKAFKWYNNLVTGKAESTAELAKQENVSEQFVQTRLNLALLSPQVIEGLIADEFKIELSLEKLKRTSIPTEWE